MDHVKYIYCKLFKALIQNSFENWGHGYPKSRDKSTKKTTYIHIKGALFKESMSLLLLCSSETLNYLVQPGPASNSKAASKRLPRRPSKRPKSSNSKREQQKETQDFVRHWELMYFHSLLYSTTYETPTVSVLVYKSRWNRPKTHLQKSRRSALSPEKTLWECESLSIP